ncbi:hypothetical protein TRAPUB_9202 [Trametes pubescens]|uniref:Uncharacterized protein n=1 Tax=Trametes pubescens TaxID=154538 RepID=A0A1M2W395_TRAPU|nr:hypothetical protein TRAPUB_9202 [Trametes pubescens]
MAEALVEFLKNLDIKKGLRVLEIPGHADALLGSSPWRKEIIVAIANLSGLKELTLKGQYHTPAYMELLTEFTHDLPLELHFLHVSSSHWQDGDVLFDITRVFPGGHFSRGSLQRLEGTFTLPSSISNDVRNLAQFSGLEVLEIHHNTVCNIEDYFWPFPSLHTLSFVSSAELDPQGDTNMHIRKPTERGSLDPESARTRDLARWRVLKTLKGSVRQLSLLKDSLLRHVAIDTLELTVDLPKDVGGQAGADMPEPTVDSAKDVHVMEQVDMLETLLQTVLISHGPPRTLRLRALTVVKGEKLFIEPLAACLKGVSGIVESHSRAHATDARSGHPRQPWDALEIEVVSTGTQPTVDSVATILVSSIPVLLCFGQCEVWSLKNETCGQDRLRYGPGDFVKAVLACRGERHTNISVHSRILRPGDHIENVLLTDLHDPDISLKQRIAGEIQLNTDPAKRDRESQNDMRTAAADLMEALGEAAPPMRLKLDAWVPIVDAGRHTVVAHQWTEPNCATYKARRPQASSLSDESDVSREGEPLLTDGSEGSDIDMSDD